MSFDPNIDPLEMVRRHHEERKQDINERFERTRWRFLWLFLAALAIWTAVDWAISQLPTQPGSQLVSISEVQPIEPPALCPGDTLEYVYSVDGAADGVVDINVTLYRKTTPARTLIYSEPLHDILIDPVHQEVYAVWTIPNEVIDPFTGQLIELTPGQYQRRISISTTSRNTKPTIVPIDFSIRQDCP